MNRCISCPSYAENDMKCCKDCWKQAIAEEVESHTKCMEILNKQLTIPNYITNNDKYKANRKSYDYHRLEVLYITNEIPRPTIKKRFRNGLYL